MENKVLAVLPSRIGSTRLPRKPLIDLNGKPLIQWVYEGTLKSKLADKVIVATDSQEIFDCVKDFGGEVMLTSPEHKTGSDRVAEIAEKFPEYNIVINIQGDMPFVTGELVDSLIKPLIEKSDIDMVALKSRITTKEAIENTSVTKVVTDKNNFAIYFSRYPIPFNRDNMKVTYYRNKGMYGFKRNFLLNYVKLPQRDIEKAESLEQLRALEHGTKIYVEETDIETLDVNVPEDVDIAKKKLAEIKQFGN